MRGHSSFTNDLHEELCFDYIMVGRDYSHYSSESFYTQEDFAKELDAALSTVNRWELNKVKPNVKAMRTIKEFCEKNNLDFGEIEDEWLYPSKKGTNYRTCRTAYDVLS